MQYAAFVSAHLSAQELFKTQFEADKDLGSVEGQVLKESEGLVEEAEKVLLSLPQGEVQLILSLTLGKILLNNGVTYIEGLVDSSLLKPSEAEEALERIQEGLKANNKACLVAKTNDGK